LLLAAAAAGGSGGAPAVVSDGEGIGELQCAVGKLTAGSIGAEEGRLGVCCDGSCNSKLGTLFSVKYVLVSVKLVCIYVKLLKI
jgi:hypothetical protein